jgi:myo-inositol-1(or 4)-monophosphatase
MDDLAVALDAAQAAATVIAAAFDQPAAPVWKGTVDPVTETDRLAEDAALGVIRRARPADLVLAEESGGADWSSDRVWIVDPLDGTVNFVHRIPQVAVSVALWVDGLPEVGVVTDVTAGVHFVARRGHGATAAGRPISVSSTPALAQSLIGTGFGYDRTERPDHYAGVLGRVLARCLGIRRIGSAALDLCWVAAGRFDGYWEERLKPWDLAAGALIVQEAGGMISALDGSAFRLDAPGVVATNGRVHDELVAVLQGNK